MLGRRFILGGAVALTVLAWAGAAQAQDFFRLRLDQDAQELKPGLTGGDTMTLPLQGDADTVLVRGGGHHGGFHGGWGGYRGWGYSPWRYGFYRPWGWGFGGYLPYYALGFGYGYPSYYGNPYSYYSYPTYSFSTYYPTSSVAARPAPATQLSIRPRTVIPTPPPDDALPPVGPPAPRGGGTFPYDGGPQIPVPMPGSGQQKIRQPPAVPIEGKLVSIPAVKAPKYSYAAYGEDAASARTLRLKESIAQKPAR